MESNHPTVGLPRPAGFEDRMGHQTPAAPRGNLDGQGPAGGRSLAQLAGSSFAAERLPSPARERACTRQR